MQFVPTKADMDRIIQDIAGECTNRMARWSLFGTKMDSLTDQQLIDLGYTSGQVAYIRSFVTALKQIELFYDNQQNDGAYTDNPKYFIDEMTRMLVF